MHQQPQQSINVSCSLDLTSTTNTTVTSTLPNYNTSTEGISHITLSPSSYQLYVTYEYPPEGIAVPLASSIPNPAYDIPNLIYPGRANSSANTSNAPASSLSTIPSSTYYSPFSHIHNNPQVNSYLPRAAAGTSSHHTPSLGPQNLFSPHQSPFGSGATNVHSLHHSKGVNGNVTSQQVADTHPYHQLLYSPTPPVTSRVGLTPIHSQPIGAQHHQIGSASPNTYVNSFSQEMLQALWAANNSLNMALYQAASNGAAMTGSTACPTLGAGSVTKNTNLALAAMAMSGLGLSGSNATNIFPPPYSLASALPATASNQAISVVPSSTSMTSSPVSTSSGMAAASPATAVPLIHQTNNSGFISAPLLFHHSSSACAWSHPSNSDEVGSTSLQSTVYYTPPCSPYFVPLTGFEPSLSVISSPPYTCIFPTSSSIIDNMAASHTNEAKKSYKPGPHMQRQSLSNKPKPTTMFQPYWSGDVVEKALNSGQLLRGSIRINEKNYENAYISHPKKDCDILFCGMAARNRALQGDEVACYIEPKKNWRIFDEVLSQRGLSKESEDAPLPSPNKDTNQQRQKKSQMSLQELKTEHPQIFKEIFSSEDLNMETNEDPPNQDSIKPWWFCVQRTAQVVAIVRQVHIRKCVGILRPPPTSPNSPATAKNQSNEKVSSNAQFTIFSPTDPKVPRVMIPRNFWPQDFHKCPEKFSNAKFVARITNWPEQGPYANGVLLENLSDLDFLEARTKEILVVSGIEATSDFDQEILAELPSESKPIEPEELVGRLDLRNLCIFTIDPPSARDLDDAIHYQPLPDGNVEMGVHIADVSHYVRVGTRLDEEASMRATSVYLVDRVIPMLPRALCEHLCTLTPGEDKLAFTVIWTVDPNTGEVLRTKFARSVIRSCAKLSYNDAQMCLDNPEKKFEDASEFAPVEAPHNATKLCDIINEIGRITRIWRKGRFNEGALVLNQPKISFHLSEDRKAPVGVSLYTLQEANHLIEELMLKANISVAEALFKYLPEIAMLRRHEPPDQRTLATSVQLLKRLGYSEIDASSSGSLQRSLDVIMQRMRLTDQTGDKDVVNFSVGTMQLLVNVCSKSMQLARYFCAGAFLDHSEACQHYALNVPFYTHFTSPIRRYPDIVVHRQLAAILPLVNSDISSENDKENRLDKYWLEKMNYSWINAQAEWSNIMKKSAKEASTKSNEFFYALFVKECGPFYEECLVFNVLDRSFDVIVVSCGLIKRVYCEQLELDDFRLKVFRSFQRGKTSMVIQSKKSQKESEDFNQDAAIDVINALAGIGIQNEEMEELDDTIELGCLSSPTDLEGPSLSESDSIHIPDLNILSLTWSKTSKCQHELPVQEIKCQDLITCQISCSQVNDQLKLQLILMRPTCSQCEQ